MSTLKMVQTMLHRWQLVNGKTGDIIKHDIYLNSPFDAETYVRAFCSGMHNWTFEVVPLPKEKNEKNRSTT